VRSALLAVKGVERAQVIVEGEAIVTYDPRVATIDHLIAAVNRAQGPVPYTAKLKELPR
jgi:hypothetical protein